MSQIYRQRLFPELEKIHEITSIMSVHFGSRLLFFLLVVEKFFRVLSVVSNIFGHSWLVG